MYAFFKLDKTTKNKIVCFHFLIITIKYLHKVRVHLSHASLISLG